MERSLPTIEAMGLDVVSVSDRPLGVGTGHRLQADPTQPGDVLAALRQAGVTEASGVLSLGYENATAVSDVAHALGCPALPREVALVCSEKDRRIRALAAAGLPTPRHIAVATGDDPLPLLDALIYPAVVKPVDLTDSQGVRRVDSQAEAVAALAEALTMARSGRAIVEELLEGTEHTLTGLCAGGAVHFAGFSDRDYSEKEAFAPAFFERGDVLPSTLAPERIAAVRQGARAGVRALGIDDGIFSCDVLVDPAGTVYMLEIACRLTGARIPTEVVPLATGIDILPNAVRLALGDEIVPSELDQTRARHVVQRYLPPVAGIVDAVGDIDAVERPAGVYDLFWVTRPAPGSLLGEYRSADDVVAGVIVEGDSVGAVDALADEMLSRVPLVMRYG